MMSPSDCCRALGSTFRLETVSKLNILKFQQICRVFSKKVQFFLLEGFSPYFTGFPFIFHFSPPQKNSVHVWAKDVILNCNHCLTKIQRCSIFNLFGFIFRFIIFRNDILWFPGQIPVTL